MVLILKYHEKMNTLNTPLCCVIFEIPSIDIDC